MSLAGNTRFYTAELLACCNAAPYDARLSLYVQWQVCLGLPLIDCRRLVGRPDLLAPAKQEARRTRHAYRDARYRIATLKPDDPRRAALSKALAACMVPRPVGADLGIWRPVDTSPLVKGPRRDD